MKIVDVAECLLQIAAGRELEGHQLRQLADYFSGTTSDMEAEGFIDLASRLQNESRHQPGFKALVGEYLSHLDSADTFTESQAQTFIDQFVDNLGPTLLWTQALVLGYARRIEGSPFDIVADQTSGIPGWMILYTTEGEGVLDTGIRRLTMNSGDAVLFEPGAVFSYYRAEHQPTWGHYWLAFQAEANWRDWMSWPRFGPHIGYLHADERTGSDIEQNLELLNRSFLTPGPMKAELDQNLLQQLLLRCKNLLPVETDAGVDPRITRAQEFIELNFSRSFSLEEVAEVANVSASRMAHIFREHTGVTIIEWRDEKRMMTAAQMLRSSRMPIASIAAEVGYIDAPFFSRSFKRLMRCTPRQYRNGSYKLTAI